MDKSDDLYAIEFLPVGEAVDSSTVEPDMGINETETILVGCDIENGHEAEEAVGLNYEAAPLETRPGADMLEEVRVLAGVAISQVLSCTDESNAVIPWRHFSEVAFESPPDKQSALELKRALKLDGRLEYLDNGQFGVIGRMNPDTYWPGRTTPEQYARIAGYVLGVVRELRSRPSRQYHSQGNVLGIVKNVYHTYLNADEQHELFTQLISHPDVTALPNGGIRLTTSRTLSSESKYNNDTRKDLKVAKSLNDRAIRRRINEIDTTEEMHKARDLATNKADTRRHGRNRRRRGSRSQGRRHGKTLSFEQILERSQRDSGYVGRAKG